jgi:hypothetical protein
MTLGTGARTVIVMKNGRISPNTLIIVALTAVVSLAAGHLVDLGTQVLGSGPASTPALIGDIAGLAACAISARFGWRHIGRSRACPEAGC